MNVQCANSVHVSNYQKEFFHHYRVNIHLLRLLTFTLTNNSTDIGSKTINTSAMFSISYNSISTRLDPWLDYAGPAVSDRTAPVSSACGRSPSFAQRQSSNGACSILYLLCSPRVWCLLQLHKLNVGIMDHILPGLHPSTLCICQLSLLKNNIRLLKWQIAEFKFSL